jgi:hypothetical protein
MLRKTCLLFALLLAACGRPVQEGNDDALKTVIDTIANRNDTANVIAEEDRSEENYDVTYFVLVADTGLDYYALRHKMISLHSKFKIPIDTMGRFYNQAKDLIALPDNDEDEIYAGEYYPRRFPSDNLSIEYLNFYSKQSKEKTIALLTGIYETEKSADSALSIIKQVEQNAFIVKADIYIGCIH